MTKIKDREEKIYIIAIPFYCNYYVNNDRIDIIYY